jgi:two-component system CheB/CheR fusion protein
MVKYLFLLFLRIYKMTKVEQENFFEEMQILTEELRANDKELQATLDKQKASNDKIRILTAENNQKNIEIARLSGDLNNVLKSMALPIIIISEDLLIRLFTPATQEIFNFIVDDIGRPFSHVKHNLRIKNIESLISETIKKNTLIEIEVQDFSDHWFLLKIRPNTTQDNRIDGAICLLLDIHVAKVAKENAEAFNIDLILENKIRLKFISSLSHDLLTPLTSAKLNSQLIGKKLSDRDFVKRKSTSISQNIDRVVNMINDLLNVQQVDSGHALNLKIKKSNIAQVFFQTITSLSEIHGDRFIYNNPETIIGYWDSAALQRVLENLCSNAIKYGNQEPITVTLKTNNNFLELVVHNKGNAINREYQSTMFELFSRRDNLEQIDQAGWGIGLTFIKDAIAAHQGYIKIQSIEGYGTSFIINIPMDLN